MLPELRRLVFAGRQQEAAKLADEKFLSLPRRQMAFQPCGDLRISFAGATTNLLMRLYDSSGKVLGESRRVEDGRFSGRISWTATFAGSSSGADVVDNTFIHRITLR